MTDNTTVGAGVVTRAEGAPASATHGHGSASRPRFALAVAALGVVFGDIGTSPLYAIRECLNRAHGVSTSPSNVFGIVSLVFWALTMVISVKYVAYILRADNDGEGGILALTALATTSMKNRGAGHRIALTLGLFGASLLFGDGIITPAISVLSAVEGLGVATPSFEPVVVPLAIVILIVLFSFQARGTGGLGAVFGPVMFHVVSDARGARTHQHRAASGNSRSREPGARRLVLPAQRAARVSGARLGIPRRDGGRGALCGHGPLRRGADPARVVHGDLAGAAPELLRAGGVVARAARSDHEARFYNMIPSWGLYPVVALSTMATIIASQALISGAFSVTRQALMLGYLPRVQVLHTSDHQIGQIYVPIVNWALMIAAVVVVWGFGSSSGLAAAYGVAVTLDMTITTLLAYVVARQKWKWRAGPTLCITIPFLTLELTFLSSNLTKIAHGGWFPLAVGAVMFTIFTTWRRGRQLLYQRMQDRMVPLDDFFELLIVERTARVPGTKPVYMTGSDTGTPPALLQGFLHMRAVHEHVVLLTIVTEQVARVPTEQRLVVEELPNGFRRAIARYGFTENPDVPTLLELPQLKDYSLEYVTCSSSVAETVLPTRHRGMALWRRAPLRLPRHETPSPRRRSSASRRVASWKSERRSGARSQARHRGGCWGILGSRGTPAAELRTSYLRLAALKQVATWSSTRPAACMKA